MFCQFGGFCQLPWFHVWLWSLSTNSSCYILSRQYLVLFARWIVRLDCRITAQEIRDLFISSLMGLVCSNTQALQISRKRDLLYWRRVKKSCSSWSGLHLHFPSRSYLIPSAGSIYLKDGPRPQSVNSISLPKSLVLLRMSKFWSSSVPNLVEPELPSFTFQLSL